MRREYQSTQKRKNQKLLEAAERGYVDSVEYALNQGATACTHDEYGWCPIHLAAFNGCRDIVALLLARGVDPSVRARKQGYGYTPLHCAAHDKHEAIVQLLLDAGASPNSATDGGETPLQTAAYAGNMAIVKLLLRAGAKLDAKNKNGSDALIYAVLSGSLALVKFFLSKGLSFQYYNKEGRSPFFYVCENKTTALASYLLKLGADIAGVQSMPGKMQDNSCTTIDMAAENLNLNMVRFLAEQGAIPKTLSPLCLALEHNWDDIVPMLLARKAVCESELQKYPEHLLNFIYHNNSSAIKTLLSCGIKFRFFFESNRTVLNEACSNGCYEIVQALLEAGVDPNFYTNEAAIYLSTALMNAARFGHTAIASLLLAHGANPFVQLKNGDTAYDLAVEEEHHECAAVIRKAMEASGTQKTVAMNVKRKLSADAPWTKEQAAPESTIF